MTKYFVDTNGNYIGGFCGAEPPLGSIEVPIAPDHSAQIWGFGQGAYLPLAQVQPTPLEQIRAIEAAKADDTAKVISK